MTLNSLDQFPGRSHGDRHQPEKVRRQIAQDVPLWSDFIRQEAERFAMPYFDTSNDFFQRSQEASLILTASF
jgi:hypothetical protein